ncbi:MAG: hypothetical protein GY759_21780 [Chloroflexi bacterium]|nr:hypothetical protein [Chloroflexota bacterium]
MEYLPKPTQEYNPLETAAWYWLAHDSGLGLRRAKAILTGQISTRNQSLHEVLVMGATYWGSALDLSPEEISLLEKQYQGLDVVVDKLAGWQLEGIGLLRWNEPGYPPTLRSHLSLEQQPALLSYRGEPGLLDLPAIMACADTAPKEEVVAWTVQTLFELAGEGAAPLAVARAGLDTDIVKAMLQVEAPLLLVLPRGLAEYQPPGTLRAELEAGRVLLLSPFDPEYSPPAGKANPMLPHASSFAQALANALLLISPPYPQNLTPEQPCFLRPDTPKTVGCQQYYTDPESLFLALTETPTAAAMANVPHPPASPQEVPIPEAAIDPDDLIDQLSALGNVPEAMKTRLRAPKSPPDPI